MSVVTTTQFGAPFTERDLEPMPDDGRRYEVIDGVLFVTPSPVTAHPICVVQLTVRLRGDCPEGLRVLVAPYDVRLAEDTVIQPDVLVGRQKSRLERAGCPSYWVV